MVPDSKKTTKESYFTRQLRIESSINLGCHSVDNYNASDLDTAIGELIYCAGLPFSFGGN